MKQENALPALIYFIVFIFFKRIYDFTISIMYPEQEIYLNKNLNKIEFRKIVIRFRTLFALIALFWLLYLVGVYKYNTTIYLLLFFIFSSNVFYILVEKRIIYLLVDKEKLDEKLISTFDKQGGIVINIIFLAIYSYLMYKLFANIKK